MPAEVCPINTKKGMPIGMTYLFLFNNCYVLLIRICMPEVLSPFTFHLSISVVLYFPGFDGVNESFVVFGRCGYFADVIALFVGFVRKRIVV